MIILASFLCNNVDLYTEQGKFKLTFKLPAGHKVHNMAFHFIMRKILVLSCVIHLSSLSEYSYFLHCYSETGKLENSTFLCKKERSISLVFVITSHPSGSVAVVEEGSITYI